MNGVPMNPAETDDFAIKAESALVHRVLHAQLGHRHIDAIQVGQDVEEK
jgi:hypothetical protein